MMEQLQLQQQVFGLKRMLLFLVLIVSLLSVATLGTSFAAATLAKDTNVVNGNLVVKADDTLVATRSRGSHIVATVDMGYVRRLRRRMLGFETPDDRRRLQEGGGEIVATVPLEAVVHAITTFEENGTPISVTASVYGIKYNELVAGSGLSTSEEAGEDGVISTWYRGIHAQEVPEPTYDIHCGVSDAAEQTCDVYQIGDIGAHRRMNDDEKAHRRMNNESTPSSCDYDQCQDIPEIRCIFPTGSNCTEPHWDPKRWYDLGQKQGQCRHKVCEDLLSEDTCGVGVDNKCKWVNSCEFDGGREKNKVDNNLWNSIRCSGSRQESFVTWVLFHFFIVLVAFHQFS
jgi:hypothetical protein